MWGKGLQWRNKCARGKASYRNAKVAAKERRSWRNAAAVLGPCHQRGESIVRALVGVDHNLAIGAAFPHHAVMSHIPKNAHNDSVHLCQNIHPQRKNPRKKMAGSYVPGGAAWIVTPSPSSSSLIGIGPITRSPRTRFPPCERNDSRLVAPTNSWTRTSPIFSPCV